MKTEQISAAFLPRLGSGEHQLIYAEDKDQWLKSLTEGQILKGRVLREYGEKKYGVDFGGHERIVDSAIPLSKGDTLSGRVIGLNERVVSMTIVNLRSPEISKEIKNDVVKQLQNQSAVAVDAEKFKVDLKQSQELAIINASKHENATVAIRVGLYLAKLGLPITTELVRMLTNRVLSNARGNYVFANKKIPELVTLDGTSESKQLDLARALEELQGFFVKDYETNRPSEEAEELDALASNSYAYAYNKELENSDLNDNPDRDNTHGSLNEIFAKILNVSNGSQAPHRLQTLALILNDQLIEFDVAFFDQPSSGNSKSFLNSKCLKFSLKTEFGLLNLETRIINDRLTIGFSAESDFLIAQMEEYSPELSESLGNAGWLVDKIKYDVTNERSTAAYEVIKHVLEQDSLNIVA